MRYVRSANQFIGFALLGVAFIGAIVVVVTLWPLPKDPRQIEMANNCLRLAIPLSSKAVKVKTVLRRWKLLPNSHSPYQLHLASIC